MKTKTLSIILMLAVSVVLFSCGGGNKQAEAPKVSSLTAAGATFPYPLYAAMFDKYNKTTSVKVNYQAIGSGGGIRQLMSKTVDFGASDAFLNNKQLSEATATIVHIPTCLGAVVLSYNLPGNPTLKITSDIIADIFLGKIKKWNDPAIKALNPDVSLPKLAIVPVHRSDGSGTTFIFSDYLSKTNSEWKDKVGNGTSLNWPVGLGGKGNPGVAGIINQTPGAFGYVELIYALSNHMPYANLKNQAGNFVTPTLESTKVSANVDLPADTRVSLTNTIDPNGYPITSFTWLILYKEQNYNNRTESQAKATVDLIWWMIHEGQSLNEGLFYAPLPPAAQKKAEDNLKSITYNGKSLLSSQ